MIKLNIQMFGGRGASSRATQRSGFGSANKDGIPVYNGKIDYTGDFSGADVSKMTNKQLTEALDTQTELYQKALNETLGDQRTRNGRMNKIFNTAQRQQYESGQRRLYEEMERRNMPRYNIYDNRNGTMLVSAPTKKIGERQLKETQRVNNQLAKDFNWSSKPELVMKKERKTMQ